MSFAPIFLFSSVVGRFFKSALKCVLTASILMAFSLSQVSAEQPSKKGTAAAKQATQQSSKADSGKQAENQLPMLPWTKICPPVEKGEPPMCMLAQEVRMADTGQLVTSFSLRMPEGKTPFVLVTVPTGVLLQPGMRLQIDNGEQMEGRFLICDSAACLAQFEGKDNLVADFKKGTELSLIVMMPGEQKATAFKIALNGFTKALDGSAVTAEEYQSRRDKFIEQIRKSADSQNSSAKN